MAFNHRCYPTPNTPKIWLRNADGSGLRKLTTENQNYAAQFETDATFSADGSKVAYIRYSNGFSLYVTNADGTGTPSEITAAAGNGDLARPIWIGNRVYFNGTIGGVSHAYWVNADNTGSATQVTPNNFNCAASAPSSDGSNVVCVNSGQLSRVTVATQAVTQISSAGAENWTYDQPSQILNPYPATPPSNATVSFNGPSPSDAPYTRQITVGLSATGNQRFEFGWSSSATTAPNASYLQTVTNMTTKKGPVNFLGKYSGSGTVWNGGTQPDQDWYLWTRSVKTNGTANAWGTPLKVHTPKQPVWVAAGDSYTSGHVQASDQPQCPTEADAGVRYLGKTISCAGGGNYLPSNDPTPNSAASSWATTAVASYNGSTHAPAAWQITLGANGPDGMPAYLVARSGAPTSQFGRSDLAIPGTAAWASGDTQSAKLAQALYSRYNSWNVVSMTGGADDTNWIDVLGSWYFDHWNDPSVTPWGVNTGIADCPHSNDVYNNLTVPSYAIPGTTVSAVIQANLQGMTTIAAAESPGVRVLNVGYPYTVNSTGNSCYADSGGIKGVKSVIDELNSDHAFVSGANQKYVDLSTAFGTSPMTTFLQPRRLYGYPHPTTGSASTTGQSKIAATVVAAITGSGW